MTTCPNNSTTKNAPSIYHYDRSVFYTPMHTAADKPCKPVRNRIKTPIKLTVTLKDIGLEGLDSPIPDETAQIRKREHQKQQEKLQNSHEKNTSRRQMK